MILCQRINFRWQISIVRWAAAVVAVSVSQSLTIVGMKIPIHQIVAMWLILRSQQVRRRVKIKFPRCVRHDAKWRGHLGKSINIQFTAPRACRGSSPTRVPWTSTISNVSSTETWYYSQLKKRTKWNSGSNRGGTIIWLMILRLHKLAARRTNQHFKPH